MFGRKLYNFISRVDWLLLGAASLITSAGMVTMYSFGNNTQYFSKQILSLIIALIFAILSAQIDFRFLKNTSVVVSMYVFSVLTLLLLFVLGYTSKGAQSWFRLGFISFQPSDLAKVILIILLAKYFSRRHMEIRNIRHIIVSGIYSFIVFMLIFIEPDFGSAVTIFLIWLGMVLVSGISYKHILAVFFTGALAFFMLWHFVFVQYQKDRIMTFINPLADIRGAGYNAYQSMIAVGSGQVIGKGIGYGTQSRLRFLPEYQTDFIFSAFSEEWGLIGAVILFLLYLFIIFRIAKYALSGESNFEMLFMSGISILLLIHLLINIGMNIGLLPVTGVTLPFMSYGGSHLFIEYLSLGIIMGMKSYSRDAHKDHINREIELYS